MKLIYNKFVSPNILVKVKTLIVKMERSGTSHNKLEQTETSQKQIQTANRTKKSLFLCEEPVTLIYTQWF